METNTNKPTPGTIMQIGTGFWASKILLSAVHFSLFTRLAEKNKMSAMEIKSAYNFKCIDRHVYDFLDTLTAFGFLKREGLLETAMYSNGADTDFFLDKNKQTYIGGILEMMNNRLYQFWGDLEEGLLTGMAQNEIKNSDGNPFDELYKSPKRLSEFINAMSGIQMENFMSFSNMFDFTGYKTLVDIGGSGGLLSLMVAKNQPHMNCITFDLPPVEPFAIENIQKFQLTDRVKTGSGDFLNDPLPKAEIVVMGNILHDWDEERKLLLIKKAYDALPVGGSFVTIENIIDEDRNKNVLGLMMSLNMLIETGKGFDYTFSDFNNWANQIGFKSTRIISFPGPASACVAIK